VLLAIVACIAAPATADWNHPVKWDQLAPVDSQAAGSWLEYDRPSDAITADDYLCAGLPSDRYITDIEFTGFSSFGPSTSTSFACSSGATPRHAGDAGHPDQLLYSYDVSKAVRPTRSRSDGSRLSAEPSSRSTCRWTIGSIRALARRCCGLAFRAS